MQYVDAFEGTPAERRSSGMDKSPTTIVVWKRQIPASSDSEDTVTCELKFKVSENSFVAIWQPHDPDITEAAFLVDEDEDEFFADPSFAIIRYTKGINDGSFTYRPGGREETTAVKPLQFHSDLKPVNDIICEQSSFALPTPMSKILETGAEFEQKGPFSTALEVFLEIAEIVPNHENEFLLEADFESGGRIWHHQNGYWLAFTCDGAHPKFAREKPEVSSSSSAQEGDALYRKNTVYFESFNFEGRTFTQAKEEHAVQQRILAAEAQANEEAAKIATQTYGMLMSGRPAVDFDCSQLLHPERVRAVLKNAAKEHPDAAAKVTTMKLCHNALVDSDQLLSLLQNFSGLKHLDISHNSTLRFLSFDFMRFVTTRLQSFVCNDCPLVFPPQREVWFQVEHPDADVQHALKGLQGFLNKSNIDLSDTKMNSADCLKIASELQKLVASMQSESSPSQLPITINISKNPELKGSRLEGLDSGCVLILSKLEGPQLQRIQELNLSEAGLKDFDNTKDSNLLLMLLLKELLRFPNLKKLDISKNSLRALPAGFIKFASRLKEFNCSGCNLIFPPQLVFSPPFCTNPADVLVKLRQLLSSEHNAFRHLSAGDDLSRVLNLSGLELPVEMCKELAPMLPNLDRLKEINLQNCCRLNGEGLDILINHAPGKFVSKIVLSGSDIEYIPHSLAKFASLTEVKMDNCKKLTLLPSLFAKTPLISVAQCPNLCYPPKSICKTNDMHKIQRFLQKAVLWKRLKVVFLGNGRSGKSSLLRCLAKLALDRNEASTRGVKVDVQMDVDARGLKPNFSDWFAYGKDLDPTFWDFAGQLEYSASHHYFLSSRQAVYVIVFSVVDDYESVQQQLSYWLSLIPNIFTRYVRVIIAGTKIDLLPASAVSKRLDEFRTVVELVLQARGGCLVPDELSETQFVTPQGFTFSAVLRFTTADRDFRGFVKAAGSRPDGEYSWKKCRAKFKKSLYMQMNCIFHKDDDTLKYPPAVKEMKKAIENDLKTALRGGLPCCPLADPRAVDALGALFGNPASNKNQYHQSEVVMDSLGVLHDLGIVVLYNQRKSICVEPQYLPGIMALFVDPATELSAQISNSKLKKFLQRHAEITRAHTDAEIDELLRLLKSVGILCVPGRPTVAANRRGLRLSVAAASAGDVSRGSHGPIAEREYLIPLALRGRPVTWSQVHVVRESSDAVMMGRRLGNSGNSISSAAFLEIMLKKCNIAERMWGCAFAYEVDVPGPNSSSIFVFVRLKEDRSCLDVVILMPDNSYACKKCANHELDSLFVLLRRSLGDEDDRLFLCPVCCSSNAFVRWGVAHTFYEEELTTGSSLRCGRCHDVTVADVRDGKVVMLDFEALPLVYPKRLRQLQLPWKHVGFGGIVVNCAENDASTGSGSSQSNQSNPDLPPNAHIPEGLVSDTSFFVLTGQLKSGDCIAADYVPVLQQHLQACVSQDVTCDVQLVDGTRRTLVCVYHVGDTLPNGFMEGAAIKFIFPGDVGERVHDPGMQLPRFCANDCVIVLFGAIFKKTPFIYFPGSSNSMQMARLTPELCQVHTIAARCWSELQDQVSVVLGTEYEMYQITALTIFRNETRAAAFMAYREDLRQRQLEREARNESDDEHWTMTPDDVAQHLGSEFASFKDVMERLGFFRRLMNSDSKVGLSDSELGILEREVVAGPRGAQRVQQILSFKEKLQKVKEMAEARKATMWRFENSYSTKFGVGNPQDNVNINLSVAWWGKKGGNAVYQAVAQNGFANLPSDLKLDQGFYGNGFYFTRYPRYSDYYISGCKLDSKDIGASFLMNYVLCGRPFPVTRFPDSNLPLMGQPCSEEAACKGGSDRHDSHYVCVKAPHFDPCGAREEPDFDEIVLFNPVAVLPMVSVEFTRRLKTLLWLDARPDRNYHVLKRFAGCPARVDLLTTAAYPMKQHCSTCGHALSMDANPYGTLRDLEKCSELARREIEKLKKAVAAGDAAAIELTRKHEAELQQAEAAIPAARAATDRITLESDDDSAAKNLSQEQQVHVMLFLHAEELATFLRSHPELRQYPSSLLRIITTQQQFAEPDGLQQFFDSDATWRFKFPTTLVTDLQDDLVTMARPNMWLCKSQRDARGPAAAAAAGGASGGGGAAAGGAAASGDGAGRLSIFQEQLWRFGTFQSLALLGKK